MKIKINILLKFILKIIKINSFFNKNISKKSKNIYKKSKINKKIFKLYINLQKIKQKIQIILK